MKDIIEKYKNGELTMGDFLDAGYGGVVRVDLVTAKIINSDQLDKEIAAMEIKEANEAFSGIIKSGLGDKMKRYKYEKVDNGESWSVWQYLKAYEDMKCDWYVEENGKYCALIEWFNVCEVIRAGAQLYHRIELTQEELEAQKVDDLVAVLYDSCSVHLKPETLNNMAKKALEWMKQEG